MHQNFRIPPPVVLLRELPAETGPHWAKYEPFRESRVGRGVSARELLQCDCLAGITRRTRFTTSGRAMACGSWPNSEILVHPRFNGPSKPPGEPRCAGSHDVQSRNVSDYKELGKDILPVNELRPRGWSTVAVDLGWQAKTTSGTFVNHLQTGRPEKSTCRSATFPYRGGKEWQPIDFLSTR